MTTRTQTGRRRSHMGPKLTSLGDIFFCLCEGRNHCRPIRHGKVRNEHKKGNIRSSLENMGETIGNGRSVLIYPEEELTVGDPTKPFLNGTGLMTIAENLPVIPMRINIEGIGKPTYIPFIKRWHVTVRFGAPIMPPWESDSEKVTQLMEKSVANLAS